MKIQILGTGCPKCQALEANAKAAVAKAGLDAQVEKISDIAKITDMGVMVTPAIAVDGVVKRAGKLLSADEIIALVKGA